MRQLDNWILITSAASLLAGCAVAEDPNMDKANGKAELQRIVLSPETRVDIEGILDYGTVVFAENPTTLLEANDFHGYEFDGKAGGVVTITMTSSSCGAPDTLLALFGPENLAGDRGRSLIENDDAFLFPCILDSRIRRFRLPTDGRYLVIATSFLQEGGGHYRLALTCDNAACALPGAPTFASTRIAQADIDRGAFAPDALFEIGDFLFETVYRVDNGMGNALTGLPANNKPRPNFRPFPNNVHFAAFGGPEAQSCVTCHNVGGDDGAGDNNHNIFQIGDGVSRASGVPRNPIALLGLGLRQRAAEEMTAEIQALLAAGKVQAAATGVNVTVALRPPTNPTINFGTVIARPDGSVDFTALKRIDADLVVKPFGWKGREQTIRRFIEGGWRVHFGLQTEPSVNKHCITPNVNTFGNGPNCQDPDGDGVVKEISDGQLTAEAVYLAMLEMPIRIPAANAAAQARVNQGEVLFKQVGCEGCHRQFVTVKTPRLTEKPDTTGGAGITINFATDMREPRPAVNADGSMTIEVWSDFRRFQMGPSLADSKPFNQIAADTFVTPPLWGIRDSAPYLHDGRAATLLDSVLLHGEGDDTNSINSFRALTADDQKKVVEFMESLGRVEDLP
jgi:mono/diheme cytochrome c family protein